MTKITKNMIKFVNSGGREFYKIDVQELKRDGLHDWIRHLREKDWFGPSDEKALIEWAKQYIVLS